MRNIAAFLLLLLLVSPELDSACDSVVANFRLCPKPLHALPPSLLVDLLLLDSWPQAHSHVCLDLMLWQKRAASLASLRCVTEASKVLH